MGPFAWLQFAGNACNYGLFYVTLQYRLCTMQWCKNKRSVLMNTFREIRGNIYLSAFLLLTALLIIPQGVRAQRRTYKPDLEYFKALMDSAPTDNTNVILGLMSLYSSSRQYEEGIAFYERIIDKFDKQLTDTQEAYYLCALAALRLSNTENIGVLNRYSWANKSVKLLKKANKLTGNDNFIVHWMSGTSYANFPGIMGKKDEAKNNLNWCLDHIDKAPHAGWVREVYYHMGFVYHKSGNDTEAKKYLDRSGYKSFDKNVYLTTPLAVEKDRGTIFSPLYVNEIVPGTIFCVSGCDFTEFFFVKTSDGNHLIAINSGSRPEFAQHAYDCLKDEHPDLPPLTDVFITSMHWFTIGGHDAFRNIAPEGAFYCFEDWNDEYEKLKQEPLFFEYLFGTGFKKEYLEGFQPDTTIAERTTITVGGSTFEVIPQQRCDRRDVLLIYMPEHSALFLGSSVLPYLGMPFLDEGDIPGLFDTIDLVTSLQPNILLHSHAPLNRYFDDAGMLKTLKPQLQWLRSRVQESIHKGTPREDIHSMNLMPPDLVQTRSTWIPYLAFRGPFIDRVYDQTVGYWHPDLGGMFALTDKDFGMLLTDYLDLSSDQVQSALQKMIDRGEYELAAKLLMWIETQYPGNREFMELKKKVYILLKEKSMELHPLKFVIYSETIGDETPQLTLPNE